MSTKSTYVQKLFYLTGLTLAFVPLSEPAATRAGEPEEKISCAAGRQAESAVRSKESGAGSDGHSGLSALPASLWPQKENGVTPPPAIYWQPPSQSGPRTSSPGPPQTASPAAPIADNSFLIEEAYNQEYGVVQHINAFQRNRNGDWEYTFTQEWPIQAAPKHQLSYTLAALNYAEFAGTGGGFGDILLNYRYQFVGYDGGPVAFAPRVSLLLPTGDPRFGRGAGGAGVEFNLPLSLTVSNRFVTHFNAGGSIVPDAENSAGDEAAAYGYFVGQSFIWLAHPRFHPLLEILFSSQQAVAGPGDAVWENSVVINPGFRWAHNFANGLQIVPGIAFPVEVGRARRGEWGVFLYLSFEHPFTSSR